MEYADHPLASLLPMMGQQEIRQLASDIQINGLRSPITILDDQILDGRNRYRACKLIGVEPGVRKFNGEGDPLAFIVSVNVKRRHLSVSQRAMVAARLANMPRGDISRTKTPEKQKASKPQQTPQSAKLRNAETLGKTTGEAAKELEVSRRTVVQAKEVLAKADPEDIEAIESGSATVNAVAKKTKEKATAKETRLDKTGYPIPESILEDWRRAESFSATLRQLQLVKLEVEKAVDERDLIFREITSSTLAELKNAWSGLQGVIPYAVCPTCQGRQRAKCTLCKQRGFISKFGWDHWVPKEMRELRAKK